MTQKFNIQPLLDNGIQTRVQIDAALVEKYAELLRDGTVFPPVSVVSDGKTDWLVDGFHRAKAALECGADEIEAEVTEGDYDAAYAAALLANAKHGSPRNDGDVQKVLTMAFQRIDHYINPEDFRGKDVVTGRPNGLPSSRQLSEKTGVSQRSCVRFLNTYEVSHGSPSTENADATKVTHDHTEQRNPKVRANLKKGLDRFGQTIPEGLREVFLSRRIRSFMKPLANTRKALVRSAQKPGLEWLDVAHVAKEIEAVEKLLHECDPHCVCPECQGLGCGYCKKRGYLSLFAFDLLPTATKKALKAAGMGA